MGAVLVLAVLGVAYQAVGEARDRRVLSRPGQLVPIGHTALHVDCRGTGSPTVVLEAGATGFAATWAWVQPAVARVTRVCAYDRAGLGWSDAARGERTADTIVQELHDALERAGESGPFVLAGHSLGGVFAQVYAARHRHDVAGLVLVDPSHPDQTRRFGAATIRAWRGFVRLMAVSPVLARLGVLRATGLLVRSVEELPKDAYRQAAAFAASPRHLRTSHAELAAWESTMAQARAAISTAGDRRSGQDAPFGDRPLVVLSATVWPDDPDDALATNQAMHAETARLAVRGRHVRVAGADHLSLLMSEAHAAATAAAIIAVVTEVRARAR